MAERWDRLVIKRYQPLRLLFSARWTAVVLIQKQFQTSAATTTCVLVGGELSSIPDDRCAAERDWRSNAVGELSFALLRSLLRIVTSESLIKAVSIGLFRAGAYTRMLPPQWRRPAPEGLSDEPDNVTRSSPTNARTLWRSIWVYRAPVLNLRQERGVSEMWWSCASLGRGEVT